jgi:hypothetical protein
LRQRRTAFFGGTSVGSRCSTWPANAENSRKLQARFFVVIARLHTPEGGKDAETLSVVDRTRRARGPRRLRRRRLRHRTASGAAHDFGRTGDRGVCRRQGPADGQRGRHVGSSAANVATVDGTGLVTAVAAGTASITATATADVNRKATCTITSSLLPCAASRSRRQARS